MTECVRNFILTELPGYVNSNPKVVGVFPPTSSFENQELLEKMLPFGSLPDQFFENRVGRERVLVYVFEIERVGDRNDLVSLGFVLDKNAVVDGLKSVIIGFFDCLRENGLLQLDVLVENLAQIFNGFQKESKIKIGKVIFDVQHHLKSNKVQLSKESLKKKGRML